MKEFLSMGSVTNLDQNKTIFISCDSKNEILVLNYDHSLKIVNFSIYENSVGYRYKMSLWQRLVYCFRVLIWKKQYADQICMNNRQLKDLKVFLNSLNLD